jgi:penicillin-binding protein 1C
MAAALIVAFAAAVRLGPLPKGLLDTADDVSTVVLDRTGRELYEARSGGGLRTVRLTPADLPDAIVQATIAAEDRRFRRHVGVDVVAMGRAAVSNVRAFRVVQGASTITQQTAKLLLERREGRPRTRNLWNKVVEAIVALRLEHRLGKNEILAVYLSLAPYGNQIAGVTRASEVYFGVKPASLTVAQAAYLAGLPQRPSAYDPYRNARGARTRQLAIIGQMRRDGRIDALQADQARNEALQILPRPHAFTAPHFVDMVLAASPRETRITTTLDAELQGEIAGILEAQHDDLVRHGAHNVAVVVLDNARGEWLAWEGSGAYEDEAHGGTIDGARALRQPGSALKPFTYALAFETGDTPATLLPDIQTSYPTAKPGIVYSPRNYDGQFHGPLRARKALAGSQNVPAVELASRVGVPNLLGFLRANGFTSFDKTASHYGLGVSLGNAEVSLAELTSAYASLARGGLYLEPRAVLTSRDARAPRRVISERSAFWVTDVLSDEDARAYVFGRGGSLELPFPVAVKTGTSQAYHDNWTVGYTREATVGVWVGNFDRRPLTGSSGVTGAGPIFHAVMLAAQRHMQGREEADAVIVARPSDLQEQAICELSGMRAGRACPRRVREWLPAGAAPLPCSWHHHSEDGLLTLWPDEYRPWAASHGLLDLEGPFSTRTPETPRMVRARDEGRSTRPAAPHVLQIVSPPDGATYLIDPTLRAEFQTLPLGVVAAHGRVEWRVDEKVVGSTASEQTVYWPLAKGQHAVTARDGSGRTATATILVK